MATKDQTIALAGVFQSLNLLHSIAHHGMVDMEFYEVSMQSVLNLDADSTLGVFGDNVSNIRLGLKTMIDNLSTTQDASRSQEITRYFLGLMVLEKKLSNNQTMLEQLKRGIELSQSQLTHYSITSEDIAKLLAKTYKQTISTLSPKIMVNGESQYLNNTYHADKIRAMLLSAIRSMVLWRQRGGVRWRLIFDRGSLIRFAKEML